MSRYMTSDERVALHRRLHRQREILEEKMWTIFKRDVITNNMVDLYNSYENEWKILGQEIINLKIK